MSWKSFGQEMRELKDEILLLSSMVEQAVIGSAQALRDRGLEGARQILVGDIHINQKRSSSPLWFSSQHNSPSLMICVCLHMCTELERVADYAKVLANINLRSEGLGLPDILGDLYFMAEKTVAMLHLMSCEC